MKPISVPVSRVRTFLSRGYRVTSFAQNPFKLVNCGSYVVALTDCYGIGYFGGIAGSPQVEIIDSLAHRSAATYYRTLWAEDPLFECEGADLHKVVGHYRKRGDRCPNRCLSDGYGARKYEIPGSNKTRRCVSCDDGYLSTIRVAELGGVHIDLNLLAKFLAIPYRKQLSGEVTVRILRGADPVLFEGQGWAVLLMPMRNAEGPPLLGLLQEVQS